ncbi:MAG: hypothetical protein PHR14_04840 [Oscillospiraceae bacterium]|nr:hypothetical protein [Oscillospiraceae bacterium]
MIKALIQNSGNTLLLDIPYRRAELCEKLASIGIWNQQGDIFIRDCEDEIISVKLYGETDFDNRLISLFDEDTPLSLANTVCDILHGIDQDQRDQINYDLAHGEYTTPRELLLAVRKMNTLKLNVNYYCPLEIDTPDDDGYNLVECDNSIAHPYINDIKALLFNEQNRGDPMIEYFNEDTVLKAKLKSAVWDVEEKQGELYGVIRCRFSAPLTEAEDEIWRGWLTGQCSDGLCEGVEQRPIETEDGELYVSFWNASDKWFLGDDSEFAEYLEQHNSIGMEGM